jgi:hypothetical protein
VHVQCQHGAGQIYYSWNVQPFQDILLIHGTRGVIRADIGGMSVTVRKKGRLPGAAARIYLTLNDGRSMMTQITKNVWRVFRKKSCAIMACRCW